LMGGFEVTAKIRERETATGARTAIVAMTANALEGDREKCIERGMDDYLSKPFKAEQFQSILKKFSPVAVNGDEPAGQGGASSQSQPAEAPPSSASGFDYNSALAGADSEIVALIAGHFVADAPKMLKVMRESWQTADFETLRREAHTLSGLLGNFKAEPAQRLAADIDHCVRDRETGKMAALWSALELEMAGFIPCLASYAASMTQ